MRFRLHQFRVSVIDRGHMKVTHHPGGGGYKPMLPLDTEFKDCRGDNRSIFCFKAGNEISFRYRDSALMI